MEDRQDGSLSASELQAELDTLRSLRRRSISQPSDGIDPDLPPASTGSSSSSTAASRSRSASPPSPTRGSFPPISSSGEISPSVARSTSGASTSAHRSDTYKLLSGEGYPTNDDAPLVGPFVGEGNEDMGDDHPISDLFWLPARLHPEIAPQEFKNFIKDQTRPENLMRRSGSMLGRKKSMLSRQYQPSDGETESESDAASSPPTSRGPSRAGSFRRSTGLERLTLADLQKLEQLARQAAEDGEEGAEGEAGLKSMIRRSLSLNPAALLGAADRLHDEDKPYIDDPDAPLIAPTPGSIIRRTARTKIRKNSLLGESGGGSGERARFGSKRGHRLSPLAASLTPPRDAAEQRANEGSRKVSTSSIVSVASSSGNVADEDTSFDSSKRRSSSAEDEGEAEGEHRQTPESPERPLRSPKRYAIPPAALQSPSEPGPAIISEPLPIQYLPPNPVHGQPRVVDTAPQVDSHHALAITPVRAGADLPALHKSISPPRSASLHVEQGPSADSSPATPAGSLRTTRKAGRATSPTNLPPPAVSPTPSMSPLELASPIGYAVEEALRPVPAPEVKPALPSKASIEGQGKPSTSSATQSAPASSSGPNNQLQNARKPAMQPDSSRQTQPVRSVAQAPPPAVQSVHLPVPVANRPTPSVKEKDTASASNSKKSTWARLGLSRGGGGKEDSGTDTDDAASLHSVASNASVSKDSKKSKKNKKEKAEVASAPSSSPALEKEKEKESSGGGFFGGLFGKKKADSAHDEKAGHGVAAQHHGSGQAHLSLPTPPPTASGMLTPDGRYVNFYRLPIHIERAVYRLSHIKLANPRRPLYEQVLISNLMFWYLGVINKPTGPPPAMRQPQHQQQNQQRHGPHQAQQTPPAALPASTPGQPYHPGGNSQSAPHPPARPGLIRENSTPSAPEVMTNDDASPYEATAMEESVQERPLSSPAAMGAAAEPTTSNSAGLSHRPSSHPPAMYVAPEGPTHQSSPPLGSASMPGGTDARKSKHTGSIAVLESPRPPHLSTDVQQEMGEGRPTLLSTRRSPTEASFVVTRRDRSSSSSSISRYDSENSESPLSSASGQDGSGLQRRTSEFDSYDIISAYEYEERRKSQLAEASPNHNGSPPPMDVQTIINSSSVESKSPSSRAPPTSPIKNSATQTPEQQHVMPFKTGTSTHDPPSRSGSPQPVRS